MIDKDVLELLANNYIKNNTEDVLSNVMGFVTFSTDTVFQHEQIDNYTLKTTRYDKILNVNIISIVYDEIGQNLMLQKTGNDHDGYRYVLGLNSPSFGFMQLNPDDSYISGFDTELNELIEKGILHKMKVIDEIKREFIPMDYPESLTLSLFEGSF